MNYIRWGIQYEYLLITMASKSYFRRNVEISVILFQSFFNKRKSHVIEFDFFKGNFDLLEHTSTRTPLNFARAIHSNQNDSIK